MTTFVIAISIIAVISAVALYAVAFHAIIELMRKLNAAQAETNVWLYQNIRHFNAPYESFVGAYLEKLDPIRDIADHQRIISGSTQVPKAYLKAYRACPKYLRSKHQDNLAQYCVVLSNLYSQLTNRLLLIEGKYGIQWTHMSRDARLKVEQDEITPVLTALRSTHSQNMIYTKWESRVESESQAFLKILTPDIDIEQPPE